MEGGGHPDPPPLPGIGLMHRNNQLWKQMTYYGHQGGINSERKTLKQKNASMKITKVHYPNCRRLQKSNKIKRI